MRKIENYYFKQGEQLMSGLPLPEANDLGFIEGVHFSNCTFHPNCGSAKFKNCEFTGCEGLYYLKNRLECVTHLPSTFCG